MSASHMQCVKKIIIIIIIEEEIIDVTKLAYMSDQLAEKNGTML